MWYLWESLNILNIVWIVDWFLTFLKFCEITALSTFLIMSKSSNVFFYRTYISTQRLVLFIQNRQLKYSSHFTINKMDFRNCVFFFANYIIKVLCCVDIAMHVRLLNTKYTLFTAFHTLIRERTINI